MTSAESIVSDRFRTMQNRIVGSSGRLETLHVTDLVQDCLRKSYYSMNYPEPEKDLRTKGILYLGQAIHHFSKLGEIHEEVLCYDLKNKKTVTIDEVKDMTKEERKNVLTGSPDDVILEGDKIIISDKKTWFSNGYTMKEAKKPHIEQVNIYKWLLWKTKNILATNAVILYLDFYNRFKEIMPMEVPLMELKQIEDMIYQRWQILQSFPEKNVCWLCNGKNKANIIYCPFKELCDNDQS